MGKKDDLLQKLLDEEKLRLISRPTEELISMEFGTSRVIQSGKTVIECVIWHQIHSEDIEYSSADEARTLSAQLDRKFRVRRPQRITHSFILQATRTLFFGFYSA